jgi:hypothetical protein
LEGNSNVFQILLTLMIDPTHPRLGIFLFENAVALKEPIRWSLATKHPEFVLLSYMAIDNTSFPGTLDIWVFTNLEINPFGDQWNVNVISDHGQSSLAWFCPFFCIRIFVFFVFSRFESELLQYPTSLL